MPVTSTGTKKRKKEEDSSTSKKRNTNGKQNDENPEFEDGFVKLSLQDIRRSIILLCKNVPTVPEDGLSGEDKDAIRDWAERMQAVIEKFSLLLSCVPSATYRWGSDRSGAADQSLSVLSNELSMAQEQISSACSTRLTNVLAPVVDLVVEKVVTSKDEDGNEVKTNHYTRKQVDPQFVLLCCKILGRNAKSIRQVVLSNFHKVVDVITDYEKACKKDSQHDRSLAY